MEEWRTLAGFHYTYEVSSHGRVRRRIHASYRIHKLTRMKIGYEQVTLVEANKKQRRYYVHQLVAVAFLGPRPPGHEIDHIDGNKTNNSAGNLEYVSRRENGVRARRLGLTPPPPVRCGERNGNAKLTAKQVCFIRESRGMSQRSLARHFGVSQSTVWQIQRGNYWRHVA